MSDKNKAESQSVDAIEPASKRVKLESSTTDNQYPDRIKGITPIKPEFLIAKVNYSGDGSDIKTEKTVDYDDDAEGEGLEARSGGITDGKQRRQKKEKNRGQNKNRQMIQQKERVKFCDTMNTQIIDYFNDVAMKTLKQQENAEGSEDKPVVLDLKCTYGSKCRFEHDVENYLKLKQPDMDAKCPVWDAIGYCPSGLKCRWLSSHWTSDQIVESESTKLPGSLVINTEKLDNCLKNDLTVEYNRVSSEILNQLQRKKYEFPLSDAYIKYLDRRVSDNRQKHSAGGPDNGSAPNENFSHPETEAKTEKEDSRAAYVEAPFLPSEKRKLNLERKYIVSPLTTVGNLPYRRLMKTLGADVTYGEMALALPIVQGHKSEWALARCHSSEVGGFGVQITAAKHWQAIKAAEALSKLSSARVTNAQTKDSVINEINLNSGCPIDLVYRSGAGSALMDNASRMIRILEGMNAVSGEIPVTVKIRTGTKDNKPTAESLCKRLINESNVAAITIHGRSRQQRYTKLADWDYIGQVAKFVKEEREKRFEEEGSGRYVKPWIIGNGDVYTWEDWYRAVEGDTEAYDNEEERKLRSVDSVMVARGALIKPWIFEEVEARQHLDKSSTERLEILKQYAEFGLEHWGSDEYGVNLTRRYLCEFISFTHRYVPVGILSHLPPKLNDRPPAWKGRDEMETLMGSSDYKDWIKITELFLGKAGEGFEFTPKHKSNSYNTNGSINAEDSINGK